MRTFSTTALILLGILGLMILAIFLPGTANATLPPRPVLMPTPETRTSKSENWSRIVLEAGIAHEDAWTVVQWQGGDGVWHDVEGWRGQLVNGQVRWRVAEKDFGTGPFRWVIYDESGGEAQSVGGSFSLPTSEGRTMTVDARLELDD